MKLLDLFRRKLPKGKVVWCIGLPYTKEAFLGCCRKDDRSDFIESLELQYNATDEEVLWAYYEHTAEKISNAIEALKKKNVEIVDLTSIEQLKTIFSFSTIIITAHRHRYLSCLDFMGNSISINRFVDSIPEDYDGIIDISSCYSTTFQMQCKQKAYRAHFIAAETESSVVLRLFIYQETIKHLTSHPDSNYINSFTIIIRRIVQSAKERGGRKDNVFLGGKKPSLKASEGSASAFAPNEIKRGEDMMVQIYVYKDEERQQIICEAQKADEDAVERSYIPLNFDVNVGDHIRISLNIFNAPQLAQAKSFIWQNRTLKGSFIISVPKNYKKEKLFIEAFLSVNNAILGELDFSVSVVKTYSPEKKFAKVLTRQFKKVFISYSHLDEKKVKFIAEGYRAIGVTYFFDRHYLTIGDIYPLEIQAFIKSADLFILCWSKNTEQSEYVEKEMLQALSLAFPQVKPKERANLTIYPINIEPRAEQLPKEMKEIYNFGEI